MKSSIFILALVLVAADSLAAKGGKGNGKGGTEETATGCYQYADQFGDEVQNDIAGVDYCHGTDGQVTVPLRFRHDLKKFNENGRTIIIDALCHGSQAGGPCWSEPSEVTLVQSEGAGDQAGNSLGYRLDFPGMTAGQVSRLSLVLGIGKQQYLYFGNGGFGDPTQNCGYTGAGPVWVRCENANNGQCERWTISTSDLSGNGAGPARACMVRFQGSANLLDTDVEADFTLDLRANP